MTISCMSGMAMAADQKIEGEEDVNLPVKIVPDELSGNVRSSQYASSDDDELIITLDPGHGGYDSGATHKWNAKTVYEKTLNLKIAQACRDELEKYDGVTVYMTRDNDTYSSLSARVAYADSKNSDLLVSFHNNDSTSSSPNGSLMLIPVGNYRPELLTQSKKVASKILENLTSMGLKNNGYLQRKSNTNYYPDGSIADYYGILRNATLRNIPSMIIEHTFLSNYNDYRKYLSSNEKLIALGVADAKAIATAYDLKEKPPAHSAAANGDAAFIDVFDTDFYYESVLWAVNAGVTTGTSSNTFSPKNNCSRAEIVTFLWNNAGRPEPSAEETPFVDVKESSWYYKAVLWAVENGITSGTSATTFSPTSICTRSQAVTFLWNAFGKPAQTTNDNPFNDVKEMSWYYQPVLWAAENRITSGTSKTTFSPNAICTRGEIATFLYNADQNISSNDENAMEVSHS